MRRAAQTHDVSGTAGGVDAALPRAGAPSKGARSLHCRCAWWSRRRAGVTLQIEGAIDEATSSAVDAARPVDVYALAGVLLSMSMSWRRR